MNSFKFTLYDLFGYFIPGAVTAIALGLFIWTTFYDGTTLSVPKLRSETSTLLLIGCYVAGHMSQAAGNLLAGLIPKKLTAMLPASVANTVPQEVESAARALLSDLTGSALARDPEWLYRTCDEAVVQAGKPGDREIYTYRDGFYRGLFVSFIILGIAILVRMIAATKLFVRAFGEPYPIPISLLGICLFVCFAASILSYVRYVRFKNYLMGEAMLGFIMLRSIPSLKNASSKPAKPGGEGASEA